jgi:hypothetical protein
MASVAMRPASPPPVLSPAGRLDARVVDGLGSLVPAEWDRLAAPGDGALLHGNLAAWERVSLRGLSSRPVIAERGGEAGPVAACPGYLYDLDLAGVRSPRMAVALGRLRRPWPDLLYTRTYELGTPVPLTSPFLVADGVPRTDAVTALIGAAVEEGERAGARLVLLQNFTSLSTAASRPLAQLGFAGLAILPTAVVDLSYGSFEEYTGAMRSHYRRRARQAFDRARSLHAEHLIRFGDHAEELSRLWRLIFDRAREIKREVLTPAYFRAASELESFSVLALRRGDGSIAAFALLLDDHPWLSFVQCGFDADEARRDGVYFRLLYEIIRVGIEGGFEQLDLGVTTLEPKLDVGAVPVPLFAWLRHRNPLLQRALVAAARGPLRARTPSPRRVFKDCPSSPQELVARRALTA